MYINGGTLQIDEDEDEDESESVTTHRSGVSRQSQASNNRDPGGPRPSDDRLVGELAKPFQTREVREKAERDTQRKQGEREEHRLQGELREIEREERVKRERARRERKQEQEKKETGRVRSSAQATFNGTG